MRDFCTPVPTQSEVTVKLRPVSKKVAMMLTKININTIILINLNYLNYLNYLDYQNYLLLTKITINSIMLTSQKISSTRLIKDFQVTAAKLSLTLTSELIREGKPSDSDMMSQVCGDICAKDDDNYDQGGITCGAIDEPRKSSKAIDERVIINFRDKNVVIARSRNKNVYR